MEETKIYISKFNPLNNHLIVIKGDFHSIWCYVINLSNEIEFDGFLCSRGTLVDSNKNIQEYINNDFQPPLLREYENNFSIQPDVKSEDIKIILEDKSISILLKNIEFLRMDFEQNISYSKSISKNGPYGIPLIDK